jgi:hypothetical protein
VAIQQLAVPSPSGHPPVMSAVPDDALSETVTLAAEPPATDTSTTKAAVFPGCTLDELACTRTHRSASVRPWSRWH